MDEQPLSEQEAEAINAQMAAAMERRRGAQPERRQPRGAATRQRERRRICGYCYQPGDHPTPAHCLRALERP